MAPPWILISTVTLFIAFLIFVLVSNNENKNSSSPSPGQSPGQSPSPSPIQSPSPRPSPSPVFSQCLVKSFTQTTGTITQSYKNIPGFTNANVYDAMDVCPALYQYGTQNEFYGLPNKGDYLIFNSIGFPDWREVQQGGIGDCNLDSLVSVAAYKQRDYMKQSVIKDPDVDHVYYVRLHYKTLDQPFFVRVSALLPLLSDNDGAYDTFYKENGKPVIWSHIISKAYVVMTNYFSDFMTWGDPSVNNTGYNTLIGVDGWTAQKAIVGVTNSFWVDGINANQIDIIQKINDSSYIFQCGLSVHRITQSERFIILGNGKVCVYNGTTLENVFIPYHAYSVFAVNENTVTIRNPWGQCILSDGTGQSITYIGGLVDLPVKDFFYLFNMWFSTRQ
jgi:hypothetical protein